MQEKRFKMNEDFQQIPYLFYPNEKYLLKTLLLWRFHQFLYQRHKENFSVNYYSHSTSVMELYMVDSKLVKIIIEEILDTGEYTLEGISHYARIPVDLFFDIMCGRNVSPSMTLWAKLISLYIQVKPQVAHCLFEMINSEKDIKDQLAQCLSSEYPLR